MYYIGLYCKFVKIRLKAMVEYRGETFWTALAQAAGYFAEFAVIWIMVNQFVTIGAWNAYEIMLLFALNLLTYALAGSFFYRTCTQLPERIRTGTFDEVITRPTNPLLYLTCSGFLYGYISHITVSVVMLCICFAKLGISLTISRFLFFILAILGGALIQSSLFLFTAVPAFWTVKTDAISSLIWNGRDFIKYPISIYNKFVALILTFILPVAFINFYPAQYFLSKDDFMMFHPVFQYLTPAVGLLLFFLAYRFWLFGIKNYKSTGS